MTDHPPEDTDAEELDEDGNPLSRMTPTARFHLDRARAALSRPTKDDIGRHPSLYRRSS